MERSAHAAYYNTTVCTNVVVDLSISRSSPDNQDSTIFLYISQ